MATEEDKSTRICPICERSTLAPTADAFDLADVLERWEREVGVTFSEEVWQEYTLPTTQHVTLYRCSGCGFAMFQPVVVGSQAFYAGVTVEEEQYYVGGKWEFFQAVRDLRRYEVHRVLDVGCGSGYFLDLLRDNIPTIDRAGYEFNPEVARLARSKGHSVYHGRFPEAVLPVGADKPFDAVCMFQVLEHLPDPIGFLKDVQRLLSPSGILIVGVPDAAGPVRHFSSALTDIPPHHVSRWCESAFRAGMPRLGFRVLKVAYEPLPYYLWRSYLPVMLERDILPGMIGKALNRTRITYLLIRLLTSLGVRWLRGVPGHTLYAVLQREGND